MSARATLSRLRHGVRRPQVMFDCLERTIRMMEIHMLLCMLSAATALYWKYRFAVVPCPVLQGCLTTDRLSSFLPAGSAQVVTTYRAQVGPSDAMGSAGTNPVQYPETAPIPILPSRVPACTHACFGFDLCTVLNEIC